jgi:hypothetical protein
LASVSAIAEIPLQAICAVTPAVVGVDASVLFEAADPALAGELFAVILPRDAFVIHAFFAGVALLGREPLIA